jgi:hypothetical protein
MDVYAVILFLISFFFLSHTAASVRLLNFISCLYFVDYEEGPAACPGHPR